jgi:RNA-directed DNA polymerase
MKEIKWNSINWIDHERFVFGLQMEIYKNVKNGADVTRLQGQIINSIEAKRLAVKRVTQDNKGKRTAGIDGVKSIDPSQRLKLSLGLTLNNHASPVLRINIPKPGSLEMRPLGIPTIEDRAKQALVKFALEPEWEARFENNSYGFRPGRSAIDATWRIRHKLRFGPQWVWDVDIAKCFDRIDHKALLMKLNAPLEIQVQVEAWLNAGIFIGGHAYPSAGMGTPQGGVISPLLANIALDGLQEEIWNAVYAKTGRKSDANKLLFIRYADDFVLISPELGWLNEGEKTTRDVLGRMGLEVSEKKSQIIYSGECKEGFNFLGFNFRQIKVGRHKEKRTGRWGHTEKYQVIVVPNKAGVVKHFRAINHCIKRARSAFELISHLNPIMRGWRNYFRYSDARTYGNKPSAWDSRVVLKLIRWVTRQTGKHGRPKEFWTSVKGDNWIFKAKNPKDLETEVRLCRYAQVEWSLVTYNRIQSARSPFDGDVTYWMNHAPRSPAGSIIGQSGKIQFLLKAQKGICRQCKKPFSPISLIEVHHKKPRSRGGNESWQNQEVLHKECHQLLHNTAGQKLCE